MYQSFDAFEYVEYLRHRWRVFAAAVLAAILIAVPVSLLMPKRYTATASVVIEPQGNNDVRATTAVSAVYLESLKTYELFAASDSLFAQAVQQFHLQEAPGSQSLESLKRSILKVSKPRDTKVLEVSVTLPQPKLAQSVAQYIAEGTVSLSRSQSMAADHAIVDEAEKQVAEAQNRLEQAQRAWANSSTSAPIGALQSEIESGVELQSNLRQQMVAAQADAAEYQQQTHVDAQLARERLQAAQARASLLEKRSQELGHEIQQKSKALADRTARQGALQTELKVAQTTYETTAARLRDLRATAGTHSEQLRVIDPGIVPQRPSSPNIPLNVAVALFVALVASTVYLSAAFIYRRRPVGFDAAVSPRMRA